MACDAPRNRDQGGRETRYANATQTSGDNARGETSLKKKMHRETVTKEEAKQKAPYKEAVAKSEVKQNKASNKS